MVRSKRTHPQRRRHLPYSRKTTEWFYIGEYAQQQQQQQQRQQQQRRQRGQCRGNGDADTCANAHLLKGKRTQYNPSSPMALECTALDCNIKHCVALHQGAVCCAGLDSYGLDSMGLVGLIVLHALWHMITVSYCEFASIIVMQSELWCVVLDWIGLDWIRLDWTGFYYSILHFIVYYIVSY